VREQKALRRQGKPSYDCHLTTGKAGVAALQALCAARNPPLGCGKRRGPGLVALLEAADDEAEAGASSAAAAAGPAAKKAKKVPARKKASKKKASAKRKLAGTGGNKGKRRKQ